MKILFWIVVALIAAVLALFVISNGKTVALGFWPLSYAIELPLYLAILAALLIGFSAGALCTWIAGRHRRRELRRRGQRIAALERELAATQAQLPGVSEHAPASLATRG